MQSQKDFFEIRDFQVIIPGYEVETTVTKNEDKILELMSNEKISANIETQINSVNNIDEENSFLVGAIGNESQIMENQLQETNQDKGKRNTQNSFRTILRKLKNRLKKRYIFIDNKFFEQERILNFLAIFRKQSQQGKLEQFREEIMEIFAEELAKQYAFESKEQKIQLYLKSFLELSKWDIQDQHINSTIKRLGEAGQFKKHPIRQNLTQLKQIEEKILKI